MKTKNKVIIIDDHLLFSQSLKFLINSFDDFNVVDSFENGKDFIDSVAANKIDLDKIDIVLLDVNMPILDGLKTMEWIKNNISPEQELQYELAARSMTEREASLYRSCVMYQNMLQQAVWEIMRLELALEDLQAQDPSLLP